MIWSDRFAEVLLVEDNATAAERQRLAGVGSDEASLTITVRVHRLNGARNVVVARKTYEAGSMRSKRSARILLATVLLRRAASRGVEPVVVAGTSYGSATAFLEMLCEAALPFVVQIRPSTVVGLVERDRRSIIAAEGLSRGRWRGITAVMPDGIEVECSAAKLATVALPVGTAKLFAAQIGGIQGVHRGTIFGLSSFDAALTDLVQLVAHTRWLRRATRTEKRAAASGIGAEPSGAASTLTARANITLARQQDARAQAAMPKAEAAAKGFLRRAAPVLSHSLGCRSPCSCLLRAPRGTAAGIRRASEYRNIVLRSRARRQRPMSLRRITELVL